MLKHNAFGISPSCCVSMSKEQNENTPLRRLLCLTCRCNLDFFFGVPRSSFLFRLKQKCRNTQRNFNQNKKKLIECTGGSYGFNGSAQRNFHFYLK